MPTETSSPYSWWTREELEKGIIEVEAEIIELQEVALDVAEKGRDKQQSELIQGIEEVKAKLRQLGADPDATGTKCKRGAKDTGDKVAKRFKKGGRNSKVVKLPVAVKEVLDGE